METKPAIAPQPQTNDFKTFIQLLVDKFQPVKLICFSKSHTSNDAIGCFIGEQSNSSHHYFILMVTASSTRIEHEVQDYANTHYTGGVITILAHGEQTIQEAVHANSKFFISVLTTGKMIYSREGIVLTDDSLLFIPTHVATKAKKHLYHRVPLAVGFLKGATECLADENFNVCIFMLHQAVEQCLIALIRVHIAYRSDIHNLRRLINLCSCFSKEPGQCLLPGGTEDERLLNLLAKSYSSARYDDKFNVDQKDAILLYDRVTAFVGLTRKMCDQKIVSMEEEVLLWKQTQLSDKNI